MIERPNLDQLMAGSLGQWLQEQAAVRDDARAASNKRFVMAGIIGLPALAFLVFGLSFLGDFAFFIGFAAIMGGGVWCYSPRAKAKKETKVGINSALAQALGLAYAHDFEPGLGFDRSKSHKMVPGYSRSNFEDLWSGAVAGRNFTLHEAHLEQQRGSGKNRRYVTVFRGAIMTLAIDRDFHGTTLLERAGKHRKFLFFGEKEDLSLAGQDMQKVDMVHPEFEDEFTIYSTDQVEARYLVHPAYVERLIALETAFSGKKIRSLFMGGEVTIVLETGNMFESGGLDASRDRELIEKCIDQFMSMADLAATMNEPAR